MISDFSQGATSDQSRQNWQKFSEGGWVSPPLYIDANGKLAIQTDGALGTDATGKLVVRIGDEFQIRPGSPQRLTLRITDSSLQVLSSGARVNPVPVDEVNGRLNSYDGLEDTVQPYRGPTGGFSWETVGGGKTVYVAPGRQMAVDEVIEIADGGTLDVEGTVMVA